jgi:hypothetical protein
MHPAGVMRWTLIFRPTSLLGLAMLVAACVETSPQPPTTAGPPVPVRADDASVTLAGARCDHEAACNAVGTGHSNATRDVCVEQVGRSVGRDLDRCVMGIDPRRLRVCEKLLRNESCYPLSTLSRMIACRADSLCIAPPTPGGTEPSFSTEDVYGMDTGSTGSTTTSAIVPEASASVRTTSSSIQ